VHVTTFDRSSKQGIFGICKIDTSRTVRQLHASQHLNFRILRHVLFFLTSDVHFVARWYFSGSLKIQEVD
jgi:hypothetical protein